MGVGVACWSADFVVVHKNWFFIGNGRIVQDVVFQINMLFLLVLLYMFIKILVVLDMNVLCVGDTGGFYVL